MRRILVHIGMMRHHAHLSVGGGRGGADGVGVLRAIDEFWKDDDLETKEHLGVKCCYVETELASKVCKYDIKITRSRESFQSLTVSPQISLSAPALPAGIDQAQAMQILQAWVQNVAPHVLQLAVNDAVEKAKKGAPTKSFQRVEYMRRWEDEPLKAEGI